MSNGSVYNVGIHLTARDGVSGVLANIGKHVLGLHGSVHQLTAGLRTMSVQTVAIAGAAFGVAGMKLGHMTEKLVEHGFELRHWQAQMLAAGATSKQVADATSTAWATAGKNVNTTATENLKNIIELNKVTGSWAESNKLLPTFANVETILAGVKANGMKGGITPNSTQTLNFARGMEELGITQARAGETGDDVQKRIQQYTQGFLKSMQVSRGLFDGNQLYASTNNTAGAAQNWDFRMATAVAPVIGEIMKAGKFGNADYMAIKSYQGGKITGDAAEALYKYHLVRYQDVKRDSKGKAQGLYANTPFAEGMDINLWDWGNKTLAKLKASGMNVESQKVMNALINEIGSNKSTSGIMRAILMPHEHAQIQKELNMQAKVPDNLVAIEQNNDPFLKLQAFHKKWEDFLTALGGPLVDPAIAALTAMTKGLNEMAQWLNGHPETTQVIAAGLATVSAGLMALGAVLVGGALVVALGASAPLIIGLGALAAVATGAGLALGPLKSQTDSFFSSLFGGISKYLGIQHAINKINSWLEDFFGHIQERMTKFSHESIASLQASWDRMVAEVGTWPSRLGAAIAQMGTDIVNAIANVLTGVVSKLLGFQKTSFGGDGFGGGGGASLFNASYEGGGFGGGRGFSGGGRAPGSWGGGLMPIGNGTGPGHVASQTERAEYIKKTAMEFGIDPRYALRVAQSEGFYKYTGDQGRSFGDFQMFTGGGLGNLAARHGIDVRDPNQWKAADRFALQVAAQKHSWADWHGARKVGIGDHQGFGRAPVAVAVPSGVAAGQQTHVHELHVDGKKMATVVTKHQAKRGQFPTAVGNMDNHGHYTSPGTPLTDT